MVFQYLFVLSWVGEKDRLTSSKIELDGAEDAMQNH